jgi:hypothetical protein
MGVTCRPARGRATSAGLTPLPSLELSLAKGAMPLRSRVTGCGFGSTVSFRTATQPLPMEEQSPQGVLPSVRRGRHLPKERKAIVSDETGSLLDYVMEGKRRRPAEASIGAADRAMRERLPGFGAGGGAAVAEAWQPVKSSQPGPAERAHRRARPVRQSARRAVRPHGAGLAGKPHAASPDVDDGEGSQSMRTYNQNLQMHRGLPSACRTTQNDAAKMERLIEDPDLPHGRHSRGS